jgi:hypothetical protein
MSIFLLPLNVGPAYAANSNHNDAFARDDIDNADFRRACEEDGIRPAEFDSFGASMRTLRQFCKAKDLAALMRDYMLAEG